MHKALLILPLALLLGGCSTTAQKNFRRADLNHDGKLSRPEFSDGLAVLIFEKFDANKDGAVTIQEWRAVEGTGNDAGFKKRDPNHDGKITLAEARQLVAKGPRFKWLFEEIDTNHDGSIDKAEVAAFKKSHPLAQSTASKKPAAQN
jgi:Ca2+-binding EF-hand superfamily protein